MPPKEALDAACLQLTTSEVLLLKSYRDLQVRLYNHEITFDHIVDSLASSKSTEVLLKLANVYPALEVWCSSKEMENYWNERWAMLGRFPRWEKAQKDSALIYRPLIPQPRISSFDLLRGMWFYNQANCLAPDDPNDAQVRPLLAKAIEYHNFEAIRSYSLLQLKDLKKGDYGEPGKIIENVLASANYHGAPIYLLAALRSVQIGFYFGEDQLAESFFLRALIYLETAGQLLDQSSEAIHNAYYGQGLGESNPYGLQDFDVSYKVIIDYIDPVVFDMSAKTIKYNASEIAKNFISYDAIRNTQLTLQ